MAGCCCATVYALLSGLRGECATPGSVQAADTHVLRVLRDVLLIGSNEIFESGPDKNYPTG
jgi:hypothetical protein